MAIDAGIALGLKPVQIENPLNNMAKFYNIQNDMQTNQMNQLTMAEAARKQGQAAQYRNALSNLGDPSSEGYEERRAQAYYNNADPAGYQAIRTSELANQKTQGEIQVQKEELAARTSRDLSRSSTDANVTAWFEDAMDSHLFKPQEKVAITNEYGRIMAIPVGEERAAYLRSKGQSAAEAKDSTLQQDAGGNANIYSVSSNTAARPRLVSSTKKTLTPDQALNVSVGYDEGSVSLQAKNDSLKAKLAELNAPGTTPERAKALEGEIQQDRRSISAQQQDQESIRRADQQAKEPRQELENLLRDRAALVAKGTPKNDPVVAGMTARINYLTTHPDQIINPKKAVYHVESPDGTIRGYNALDEEISKTKPGVGKGTPENTKTMAALPGAIDEMEQGLKNIDLLVGKPEIKDVNGKITQKQTPVHAGFRNSVGMGFPGARFAPGSDSAGFHAIYSQVRGEAFMTAYKELKGGGSITEVEGTKGTAAITRMDTATSEKEFFEAAREFQAVIRRGLVRAKAKRAAAEAAVGGGTWTDIN